LKNRYKSNLILPSLVVGGVLLIISKIGSISLFGGPKKNDEKYIKDQYEQYKDIIKNLNINLNNLSFDRNLYKSIAQDQYDGMNQLGTDEKLLFDTLKGLNKDDLKVVYMDYGLRPSTIRNVAISGRKNLKQWYRAELGGSALKKMIGVWSKTNLIK